MITRDLDRAVYDAARHEDRVLGIRILPPWADTYADVLYVEAVEASGRRAVAEIRMGERHQRLRASLGALKEATR